MRLSSRQRAALFDALAEVGLPNGTEVYLFGPRIDVVVYNPEKPDPDTELFVKTLETQRIV